MNFNCPFCGTANPLIENVTCKQYKNGFRQGEPLDTKVEFCIDYYHCVDCKETSVFAAGSSKKVENIVIPLRPQSLAKHFPDYIPTPIKDDYTEAYNILYLSPKASATLSRRCLQGMIRDFWGISKNRLVDEINALKGLIPNDQWEVIDAVRDIGNIGAHMKGDIDAIIDIDDGEAEKLLKLIEYLFSEWYKREHEKKELFKDIIDINNSKKV